MTEAEWEGLAEAIIKRGGGNSGEGKGGSLCEKECFLTRCALPVSWALPREGGTRHKLDKQEASRAKRRQPRHWEWIWYRLVV